MAGGTGAVSICIFAPTSISSDAPISPALPISASGCRLALSVHFAGDGGKGLVFAGGDEQLPAISRVVLLIHSPPQSSIKTTAILIAVAEGQPTPSLRISDIDPGHLLR